MYKDGKKCLQTKQVYNHIKGGGDYGWHGSLNLNVFLFSNTQTHKSKQNSKLYNLLYRKSALYVSLHLHVV